MTEPDDYDLLAEYARTGSEGAFTTLVARYVNLVHSAALRFSGNPHHAEEITQAVFIIMARKAACIRRGTVLSGWLYQTARKIAANFVKGEIRRQRRDQEVYMQSTVNEPESAAWEQIAPLLDDAMSRLGETDRNAILLRFFENRTAREVAATLKMNEAAAHKRVNRAVEKLRKFFAKHGVTLTGTVIAGAVAANAVQAAPVGMAQKIIATVSTMTGTVAVSTFFATILGKVLGVCGSAALIAISAAVYFHMTKAAPRGELSLNGSKSVFMGSNANGVISLPTATAGSKAPVVASDEVKLDEAIARLREVLHTRPSTHSMYNFEQITNAIGEFGLQRREALNVLLENSSDPAEFVRAGAIAGMGYVGGYLPEVSPILWNMIYTSAPRDRWTIFRAIQKIGFVPADLPALTGLLTNGPISDGAIFTKYVPEAIGGVIETDPQAAKPYLTPVENLLDDPNPDIQVRAALALIKFEGTNNAKIITSLHGLFLRPNDRRSEYDKNLAAGILGDVGPAAQPLVPDLLEFAKSASEIGVQESAYDAVAKIEPEASQQNDDVAKALKKQVDEKIWEGKWKSGSYTFDDLRAALKDEAQAFKAANRLAEMGTNASEAVPDMIRALWGRDEDTRNAILEDIHKVDPTVVVTKIRVASINTGNLHEFLDKQPSTQQNKMLQQDVVTLELFSGWCLPEELADFTNKLAQVNPDAYDVFVKNNSPTGKF